MGEPTEAELSLASTLSEGFLLALEAYLVDTAYVWGSRDCSSYSARAVGALCLLRTLPEFQAQLEAHLQLAQW